MWGLVFVLIGVMFIAGFIIWLDEVTWTDEDLEGDDEL